jgi:hypothetical protein
MDSKIKNLTSESLRSAELTCRNFFKNVWHPVLLLHACGFHFVSSLPIRLCRMLHASANCTILETCQQEVSGFVSPASERSAFRMEKVERGLDSSLNLIVSAYPKSCRPANQAYDNSSSANPLIIVDLSTSLAYPAESFRFDSIGDDVPFYRYTRCWHARDKAVLHGNIPHPDCIYEA